MSNRFYYDEYAEEIFDSKIEDYPATADICSILNDLEHNQNQKAIECLKEVKESFLSGVLMFYTDSDLTEREQDKILEHYEEDKQILADIIDNKIKELEEEE